MWTRYHSVTSINETLQLLADYGERARIIAGGTDILIELERHLRPNVEVLIDISRIEGLDSIEEADGKIHLGALVTHNQVVGSDLIRQKALPLAQAAWEVGAPQIRNRATIAGNVITGSPANDTISPLLALDAEVTLQSVQGERVVPLAQFYTGLLRTVMRPDEMLTRISFLAMGDHQRGMFIKLGLRRAQAISVINVTAVVTMDGDQITTAALALGCVAPMVIRVPQAEQVLVGKTLNEETIREAAVVAANVPKPIDDIRSTAEYRTEMIKVLVGRALKAVAANHISLPHNPAMLWGDEPARDRYDRAR
jgi:CO/xanthine dehydrogenase FAD-binding subunit